MKWGTAFRLALKSFLFGLLWFIVGFLLVVGAIFLFISGIRILAFFAGFAGLFLMFFGFFAAMFKVSSGVFLGKDEISIRPVEVTYEREGLASILGQLIEQILSEKPARANIARDMKGSVVVKVRDMDATATVEFNQGRITVYNGQPVKGKFSVISADFDVINDLATGRAGTLKTMLWVLTRRLRIKGIRMARKFQKIFS
ncbi:MULTISPECIES: SCP2 sterol-binding domain-containing protein [unclassified Archaeoglobus]|jgi:membrane-bound ClpP family serine protease|uniref:SCP2 sterol-binding domain-containing protein n=1 Tax=unclassified Archaeoglobus TaxID=2643606 RepID=UPI0025B8DFE7|nr:MULTISPECIES: SCP2 sterol-binding domain-containing protein [unclassified Archaeoglobus]